MVASSLLLFVHCLGLALRNLCGPSWLSLWLPPLVQNLEAQRRDDFSRWLSQVRPSADDSKQDSFLPQLTPAGSLGSLEPPSCGAGLSLSSLGKCLAIVPLFHRWEEMPDPHSLKRRFNLASKLEEFCPGFPALGSCESSRSCESPILCSLKTWTGALQD